MIGPYIVALAITLSPATAHSIEMAAAASPMPKFTACVAERESGGSPHARNKTSSAAGKYQFLAAWENGLPFMVRDRLVQFGMPKKEARKIRHRLSRLPIHKWPEKYQDIGHAEVLERGGWRHWSLPGSRCQTLVGR